jgi:hypothetical protein
VNLTGTPNIYCVHTFQEPTRIYFSPQYTVIISLATALEVSDKHPPSARVSPWVGRTVGLETVDRKKESPAPARTQIPILQSSKPTAQTVHYLSLHSRWTDIRHRPCEPSVRTREHRSQSVPINNLGRAIFERTN